MSLKIMTIIGTRPETIKLSRVIAELDRHTRHVLVHTGQNHDYELNRIFFDELEIRKPDYFLNVARGTLTEESSLLAFPAVMLREAHERPEGMDEGTVIMTGLKAANVIDAIDVSVAHYARNKRPFRTVPDYDSDNVSCKVVRIILSYTGYVNRTVWRKLS